MLIYIPFILRGIPQISTTGPVVYLCQLLAKIKRKMLNPRSSYIPNLFLGRSRRSPLPFNGLASLLNFFSVSIQWLWSKRRSLSCFIHDLHASYARVYMRKSASANQHSHIHTCAIEAITELMWIMEQMAFHSAVEQLESHKALDVLWHQFQS